VPAVFPSNVILVIPMSKALPMAALAVGAALGVVASGLPAPAQQFSADLVKAEVGGEPRPSGKINVSRGRVRLETSDVPAGYFLVLDAEATYFLRPAAKVFMDAKQSSLLTQVFVAIDPDNPCNQWQAAARVAGAADNGAAWRCQRVGDDTVDGRRRIKYQAISPQGRQYFVWVDPQLPFPVRLQMDDGVALETVNIRETPQDDSLFSIPAGYRKFDPQHLIDRIRRSDVWVEPQK
jgi:hypothetical protein